MLQIATVICTFLPPWEARRAIVQVTWKLFTCAPPVIPEDALLPKQVLTYLGICKQLYTFASSCPHGRAQGHRAGHLEAVDLCAASPPRRRAAAQAGELSAFTEISGAPLHLFALMLLSLRHESHRPG